MVAGSLDDVRGGAVAVSDVVAAEGRVRVGDTLRARMADTRAATLRVAAIYDRSAGIGDVVLDPDVARRHASARATSGVRGRGPAADRSLGRYAASHPGARVLTRAEYLTTLHSANNDEAWGVWLIVGLSVLFAALALINTPR